MGIYSVPSLIVFYTFDTLEFVFSDKLEFGMKYIIPNSKTERKWFRRRPSSTFPFFIRNILFLKFGLHRFLPLEVKILACFNAYINKLNAYIKRLIRSLQLDVLETEFDQIE